MANNILTIGLVVIFIGVFLIIIGSITQAKQSKTNTKIAVGGFIGPIPFGFSNDKAMFYVFNRIDGVHASALVHTKNSGGVIEWN
tara:strand:- start:385 stop:639 length:255 start_codon:yes stop_codon:yes gene_type:complete